MIREAIFEIHNIISFKITAHQDYLKVLDKICSQYNNFRNTHIENDVKYDFVLHLGFFEPSDENSYTIDDKYNIKFNYFYCKDSRKLSKWKFEMAGFESGHIIAKLHTNRFGKVSVPLNIIDFLIHYSLNEKGVPLIHSSGVARNNEVLLFAARGGGGKTSLATYFTESGYGYLGDNFIILKDDFALSFISPWNIFTYNITPLVKSNLGYKKKILLFFLDSLYKITGGYFKMFIKLDIKNLLKERIVDIGTVKSVFLVIPNIDIAAPEIETISKEDLIDHLVVNQKLEFFHIPFLNYISAISYVFPEGNFSGHWEKYKANLRKNLSENIGIFRVTMPKKINREVIEQLNLSISNL